MSVGQKTCHMSLRSTDHVVYPCLSSLSEPEVLLATGVLSWSDCAREEARKDHHLGLSAEEDPDNLHSRSP